MQENPNSRWARRPSVASQTFWRSPGGPPAAAMMTSPGRACSWSSPMIWPWVSTAPVSARSAGATDGLGQGGQGAFGVGHDAGGAEPARVVGVDVDAGEADLRVLEQRLGS